MPYFDAVPDTLISLLQQVTPGLGRLGLALGGGASLALQGIPMLSVRDVAAMKLNAIANRGAKKDFYDLVELMNRRTLPEMFEDFTTKYPASDLFGVIRSLSWFEDAECDPDPISLSGLGWSDVKDRVLSAIRTL